MSEELVLILIYCIVAMLTFNVSTDYLRKTYVISYSKSLGYALFISFLWIIVFTIVVIYLLMGSISFPFEEKE